MAEYATGARNVLEQLPPPPAAIADITQNVLPALEEADVKAFEAEINNSAVGILTGKQGVMS